MSRTIHLALILAIALLGLLPAKPSSADPDFSKIGDILSGKRRLFPVDDLIVTQMSPTGLQVQTIVQTKNGGLGSQQSYSNLPNPGSYATGIGRMFKLPRDVLVTVVQDSVVIQDQNPNGTVTRTFPLNVSGTPNLNQFPRADFTGDGYADFAYLVGNNIYILTAKNVEKIDDGLFYSEAGAAPFDLTNKWAVLAAGDFDGDGVPEVALAAAQNNNVTVTIYTVTVTHDSQGRLVSISLAPSGSTAFTIPSSTNLEMAMVAGVYSGAVNPQTALPLSDLVLMYKYSLGDTDHVDLRSLQVEVASTNPTVYSIAVADTESWGATSNGIWKIAMVSDNLDFFGDSEQIVATTTETPGEYAHVAVFTLDGNLNIYKPREQIFSLLEHDQEGNPVYSAGIYSVAVGNFDQEIEQNQPIQLEIALLWYKGTYNPPPVHQPVYQAQLWLFHVDPSKDYALSPVPGGNVQFTGPQGGFSHLMAGDTQGRSALLGNPTKLTSTFTQPLTILSMPPQHVDWITPADGTQPEVLNLSGHKGFSSTYQMEQSQSNQSSSESTTSFSHSITESISGSYSWGVPDVSTISITVKAGSTQQWQDSVAKKYNKYSKYAFDLSVQTTIDDDIWIKDETQNIYVYPVIGQYVCPPKPGSPTPLCSPSELVQLNVMFSGPSDVSYAHLDGAKVEWYQPVHEPFNVFSYPWSLQQLQKFEPNIDLLTSNSPQLFATDGSQQTQKTNWSAGQGSTVTVGSAHNYSWFLDLSISRNAKVGAGGSFNFSYNGSKSISNLNTSTISVGASTGVGIIKPGTFLDPQNYQYMVGSYIFGTKPDPDTQQLDLGTDVQTNGILRAEYTADPTNPNSGSWWQTNPYSLPDVALNHPARWTIVQGNKLAPNCLLVQPGLPGTWCANFNAPDWDPDGLWTSQFLWMKGLLISPGEANGEGPQIAKARAGEKVRLQARVYNYSTTDVPPGSSVQVRFYGQPFDETTKIPAGDAFLIDQVSLAPIPGFNSQTNSAEEQQPNWVLASTDKLDTTAHADQYLAFWVLVWMQDAQGNLIGEMPGHGLYQLPGTFTSITDAAGLVEAYSNNVGFYPSLFYVAPPNAPGASHAGNGSGDVRLDRIQLSRRIALLGDKVTVRANVHAENDHDHLTALFYDGNPEKEGKAFEYETVSHIRGGSFYHLKTIYDADDCGIHDIYLDLWPEGIRTHTKLYVTLDPRPIISDMLGYLPQPLSASSIDPPLSLRPVTSMRLLHRLVPTEAFPFEEHSGDAVTHLQAAKKFFGERDNASALASLQKFEAHLRSQSVKSLSAQQIEILLGQTQRILDCVKPWPL